MTCSDGNVLCGTLEHAALDLVTAFGELSIPAERINCVTDGLRDIIRPVRNPSNGHLYGVIEEKLQWDKAKERAEKKNGKK